MKTKKTNIALLAILTFTLIGLYEIGPGRFIASEEIIQMLLIFVYILSLFLTILLGAYLLNWKISNFKKFIVTKQLSILQKLITLPMFYVASFSFSYLIIVNGLPSAAHIIMPSESISKELLVKDKDRKRCITFKENSPGNNLCYLKKDIWLNTHEGSLLVVRGTSSFWGFRVKEIATVNK